MCNKCMRVISAHYRMDQDETIDIIHRDHRKAFVKMTTLEDRFTRSDSRGEGTASETEYKLV